MRSLLTGLLLLCASPALAEEFYFASTLVDESGEKSRSGCAPGSTSIDLRSTTGKDLWICRSASSVGATGKIALAATAGEKLSGKSRTDIASALGKSIQAGSRTVPELLKELLVDSGRLKPSRNGKYEIYLGDPTPIWQATTVAYDLFGIQDNGLLADLYHEYLEPPVAWATVLAQETFTASDGDLTGAATVHTWTEFGIAGWTIASNRATTTTTATGANNARNGTTLATDDMQVEADLITVSHSGGGFSRCGVMLRKEANTTQTYYAFFADSTVTGWETVKRIANATTSIATSTQDPVNGTDRMKGIIDGSSLSGQVNGVTVVGPTTDVDITGFTYSGIYGQASTTTFTCTLDNVLAQDYPPPSSFGPLRRRF